MKRVMGTESFPAGMLTKPLPMLREGGHPDGWHDVRSPGGYEWWYFDAESAENDVRLVAILFQGFVFHPGYLRRHARWARRPHQTRPTTASDYPCAYLAVYRGGRLYRQFMTQYAPSAFSAESDRPEVRVGPNRLTSDADGTLRLELSGTPWHLTARGPRRDVDDVLSARLTFRPRFRHHTRTRRFFSRDLAGADHWWVLADPCCDVDGTVAITGRSGGTTLAIRGAGYHDHNYGTGPIGPGLRQWVWGRVLWPQGVTTFHAATARGSSADEVHLLTVDVWGSREHAATLTADWSARSVAAMNLSYPRSAEFSSTQGGPLLSLHHGRVIDASPFYLRLAYDASDTTDGTPRRGTAFCEVAWPHRLRWPILGRMIEMSIERRDHDGAHCVCTTGTPHVSQG